MQVRTMETSKRETVASPGLLWLQWVPFRHCFGRSPKVPLIGNSISRCWMSAILLCKWNNIDVMIRRVHPKIAAVLWSLVIYSMWNRMDLLQLRTFLDVSAPGHSLWIFDWTCYIRTMSCLDCLLWDSTREFHALQLIVLAVFGVVD